MIAKVNIFNDEYGTLVHKIEDLGHLETKVNYQKNKDDNSDTTNDKKENNVMK